MTSGAGSVDARSRLRRATGDASRKVSAAFFLVPTLGERRIATAASLREVPALRVVVLPVAVGFEAFVAGFVVRAPAALVERTLRAVVVGLTVRALREGVPLVAVLRPVVDERPAEAVRLVAAAFTMRVEPRSVDFAAVVRLRAAAGAPAFTGVLRAGTLRVAPARLVVAPRAGAVLVRVVVLAARAGELLVVARDGVLLALVLRVAADLPARLFAAAEREAGLLALRMVRAVALRPFAAAVRRPPARTAMARVRRPGLLSFSLLTV